MGQGARGLGECWSCWLLGGYDGGVIPEEVSKVFFVVPDHLDGIRREAVHEPELHADILSLFDQDLVFGS